MASNVQQQIWTGKPAGLVGIAILLLAGFCFGQPIVSLSPKEGPPTTSVRVSGIGFTPYEQFDIYFDSQDQALVVADAAGAFSRIAIQAPSSAVPGTHWVSVVERSGHLVKQETFDVHVNWTEFHTKDMKRDNPYENVLNVDNVGSLQKLGSYTTGGYVGSSPAVVNGVGFVGSYDGNVYAVNTRTGTLLWSYSTGGPIEVPSPAVANGVVYAGSDDGNVYALNASTGALLWSYATSGPVSWCSPAVTNRVVYVCAGAYMYALNTSTGALVWMSEVGGPVNGSPAVANGVIYLGNLALNASTGAYLWNDSIVGGNSSPAVANGVVYFGSWAYSVYALNASTGVVLWSYATGSAVASSPAVADGVVYIGSNDYKVYALNATTGALLWSYSTGGQVNSSPAVANGVVYVGSDDYKVYALNATTGAALWSYTTGASVTSSPSVVNGVVYVGSDDDKVYAFGLPRGLAEPESDSKRPDPKTLRPDFNLKVSQPAATSAGAN